MKETRRKRREGAEGTSGTRFFPLVSFDSSAVTLAILAGGEGRRMGGPKGWLRVERDETKGTRGAVGVAEGVGVPVLEWLLERLAWRGPTLLVTAPGRAHPPGWEGFDLEVEDAVAGEGPLRGVLGALEHAPTPAVVVAVVDMPGMTGEALAWLAARLGEPTEERDEMKETRGAEERAAQGEEPHLLAAAASTLCLPGDSSTRGERAWEGALAVMMRRGGTGGGRIEPFPSAWRREAAQLVRGELAAGRRSLVGLAEGAGRDKVRIIDAPPWPAELWTNLNEPADLKAWEAGQHPE